jgi:TetR/AcrR family transcriptional regulator, transcriptional repressor for nem operon
MTMTVTQTRTGRPLTSRGQATRDRIVAAAAAEIYARGVTATTLEHIKAAAEVSSSQLYHYFEDRDALVLAVIEHQAQAVLAGTEPEQSRLDSLEALRAWRHRLVAGQRQANCGGCPLGTLSGQVTETMPDARRELASGFNRWETAIRHGLAAMHQRGELPTSADPDRLATATLAAVQGGLILTQVTRTTAPLEAALDEMIAHIAALTTTADDAA